MEDIINIQDGGCDVICLCIDLEILLSGKTREGIKYQSEALKNQVSDFLFQKVSPLVEKCLFRRCF